MSNSFDFRKKYTAARSVFLVLDKQLQTTKLEHKEKSNRHKNLLTARKVLIDVTQMTVGNFKHKVESLVTLVLQSVFGTDVFFELELLTKRNKTEINPIFKKSGFAFNPELESGGGMIDIASLALRIVLQSLESKDPRQLIVLDEPCRCLGQGRATKRVGKMLKMISEKMQIQIIMVTHNQGLAENADKTFAVSYNKKQKQSIVREV